ncbi:hypothetical protein QF017_006006 [Pseudomonas laurylsulfatiphila]
MIPNELVKLIEKQPGDIHRKDKNSVLKELAALGIDPASELAEFFFKLHHNFFQKQFFR